MRQYVILRHDSPRGLHYDLMLETATLLATWALEEAPQPGRTINAQQLPDHRRIYLDYEGEVSGGRGHVQRWDRGLYVIERRDATSLEFRVSGNRLCGRARLFLKDPECQIWQFEFWE